MRTRYVGQAFSIDRYSYLRLVAANHAMILLRRGAGCLDTAEIVLV